MCDLEVYLYLAEVINKNILEHSWLLRNLFWIRATFPKMENLQKFFTEKNV